MALFPLDRRHLPSGAALASLFLRATPAVAQPAPDGRPLKQPAEKTKAWFLARARELRDQAVKEGD
jgi:hypothetical protein